MKKLLYITKGYDMFSKKMNGQMDALCRKGYEGYFCYFDKEHKVFYLKRYDAGKLSVVGQRKGDWSKKEFASFVSEVTRKDYFDLIYIRRLFLTVLVFGHLLYDWKRQGIAVCYEIPTYPLEKETGIDLWKQMLEMLWIHLVIAPNVKAIPVCCWIEECKIRRKMLRIENCVDISRYLDMKEKPFPPYNGTELRMLAVVHYKNWHAYDRILRALADDMHHPRIQFTVYGNFTDDIEELMQLAEELHLDNVDFVQEKDIQDLNGFVLRYHVAVGPLGIHRKGSGSSQKLLDTSIKNKEYCAMGIPFIHASKDESFPDGLTFHKRVPEGEENINLAQIAAWYENLLGEGYTREKMFEYAKENLSFENFADKIMDKIS